jgi:hypothetical protein
MRLTQRAGWRGGFSMATATMTSGRAIFGRLFWMFLGPIILASCTFGIAQRGGGWLGLPDLTYFVVLGGMLIGRWSEFRFGHPLTATAEPATVLHLRRYVLMTGGLGLAIWAGAKLIGNQIIAIPG